MSYIFLAAMHTDWCIFAQNRLVEMGLTKAEKATNTILGLEEFTEKLCKNYKVSTERSSKFRQVSPGKAWQISASSIIVDYSDQGNWSWASPDNIFFLEFWRDFDSFSKFVLIYCSFEDFLARQEHVRNLNEKSRAVLAERWKNYHAEMMRFYHENSNRCLLLNLRAFETEAASVARLLNSKLEIESRVINTRELMDRNALKTIALSRVLENLKSIDTDTIYNELEGSTDHQVDKSEIADNLSKNALVQYDELQSNISTLKERLTAEYERNAAALKEHAHQIDSQNHEIESLIMKFHQEKQKNSDLDEQLRFESAEARKLSTENSDAQVQLQQLQEELINTIIERDNLNNDIISTNLILEKEKEYRVTAINRNSILNDENSALNGKVTSLNNELESAINSNKILIGETSALDERVANLNNELESALNSNKILNGEKSALDRKVTSLNNDLASINERLSSTKAQLEQKTREDNTLIEQKHLLDSQLKQTQEELMHLFNENQEHIDLKKPKLESVASPEAIIDFSHYLDGQGWHNAEKGGRWAGPELNSTLKLKKISKANYKVSIIITDGMSKDILNNLEIFANGHRLKTKVKVLSNINGTMGTLRRLKANVTKVEKPYPAVVTAKLPGKIFNDRSTPLNLEFKTPYVLSPAAQGSTDTRGLSLFYEKMILNPI